MKDDIPKFIEEIMKEFRESSYSYFYQCPYCNKGKLYAMDEKDINYYRKHKEPNQALYRCHNCSKMVGFDELEFDVDEAFWHYYNLPKIKVENTKPNLHLLGQNYSGISILSCSKRGMGYGLKWGALDSGQGIKAYKRRG